MSYEENVNQSVMKCKKKPVKPETAVANIICIFEMTYEPLNFLNQGWSKYSNWS